MHIMAWVLFILSAISALYNIVSAIGESFAPPPVIYYDRLIIGLFSVAVFIFMGSYLNIFNIF